tara:strand:- start:738 stop:992 length:255 start_codon:yes stop_codon:yes gene_type:complete
MVEAEWSYVEWGVLYSILTVINVVVLYETYQSTTKCIANLADVSDVKECGDAWPAFVFISIIFHIPVMYCVAAERNVVLKKRKH